jgi:hypothetical protein
MLFLRWYLWLAPNIAVALCLLFLLRHPSRRSHRLFSAYLAFTLMQFLVLLTATELVRDEATRLSLYRWLLDIGSGISALLELAVLGEIAKLTVPSDRAPIPLRGIMRWTAALLLLVAAVMSAWSSKPGLDRAVGVFQSLDFSANLLKIGLLLVLLSFTSILGVSWKSLPAGIALGFGVSAGAEMSASALLSEVGKIGYIPIDLIRMAAFHLCVVIWLFYILRTGKRPGSIATAASRSQLELWNQELGKMVRL